MSERMYRVVVTREDGNWLANVPDAQPAHTFARSLRTLDRYVREAIVLAADLPDEAAESLRLEWDYHTGHDTLDKELAELRVSREQADATRAHVEELTGEYARRLAREYSVRDVGAMLGVSSARAQQLIAS